MTQLFDRELFTGKTIKKFTHSFIVFTDDTFAAFGYEGEVIDDKVGLQGRSINEVTEGDLSDALDIGEITQEQSKSRKQQKRKSKQEKSNNYKNSKESTLTYDTTRNGS